MLDECTHAIIHLEHHVEQQDLELEERAAMITDLEQQLQVPPAPVAPAAPAERVNQILEDMLRACVMKYPGSWDKNLSWAEFSYNNSYQESLKMAPFEALYG
jgi:hypothetical protein